MIMPLYGFLEGDVIGLLLLVDSAAPVSSLIDKIHKAAQVRVTEKPNLVVRHNSRSLNLKLTLEEAAIQPLDRVDIVHEYPQ